MDCNRAIIPSRFGVGLLCYLYCTQELKESQLMNLIDLITIRELQTQDLNFILDSSVKCLSKYNITLFKGWKHKDTCQYLEQVFLHALSDARYSTFIACEKDNSDAILGYIIADTKDNHIIFQFTKYTYRKLGIQKHFLLPLVADPDQPITVNYHTKEAINWSKANKCTIINKQALNLINDNHK